MRLLPGHTDIFMMFLPSGGNHSFRNLIQEHVGPYLAAKTKMDKSDAIAEIVDKIQASSTMGGFIKKDNKTGRWHRITDGEARDKVGHAIRKAVQRLEEANPKHAAKLKKDHEEEKRSVGGAKMRMRVGRSSCRTTSPTIVTMETSSRHETMAAPVSNHQSHHDRISETVRTSGRVSQNLHDSKISSSRVLEMLQSRNAMGLPGSSNQGYFPSSSALRGLPAVVNSAFHDGNNMNFPIFPSPNPSQQSQIDPSILTRLLSPLGLLRAPASLHLRNHALNHPFGIASQVAQAAQADDRLWLTAIVRQQRKRQQEEIQRLQDLEYARRLAHVAGSFGSSFQSNESPATENQSSDAGGRQGTTETTKPEGKKHRNKF
jgi:hypothetical protein